MTARLLLPATPLEPSPDEGRAWLRRELLRPEYQERDLLQRLLAWLERMITRGLAAASEAPPLSTLMSMVVGLLLLGAIGWLIGRARRSARQVVKPRPLLAEESVSASELRARAEAAMAEGRFGDALVDGYRALAVRHVEAARIEDLPGLTAREVGDLMAGLHPDEAAALREGARLFDLVRYGERPATVEQARAVLDLEDRMAVLT